MDQELERWKACGEERARLSALSLARHLLTIVPHSFTHRVAGRTKWGNERSERPNVEKDRGARLGSRGRRERKSRVRVTRKETTLEVNHRKVELSPDYFTAYEISTGKILNHKLCLRLVRSLSHHFLIPFSPVSLPFSTFRSETGPFGPRRGWWGSERVKREKDRTRPWVTRRERYGFYKRK